MRISEMFILAIVCLLFIVGRPTQNTKQEQQAAPDMEFDSSQDHIYTITYEAKSEEEEPVVDILWMKKAARLAISEGIPYFNVLNQKIRKKFQPHQKVDLSIVEGTIELNKDPLRAEFDAGEINAMVLTEDVVQE
jgi:hypothetical protein